MVVSDEWSGGTTPSGAPGAAPGLVGVSAGGAGEGPPVSCRRSPRPSPPGRLPGPPRWRVQGAERDRDQATVSEDPSRGERAEDSSFWRLGREQKGEERRRLSLDHCDPKGGAALGSRLNCSGFSELSSRALGLSPWNVLSKDEIATTCVGDGEGRGSRVLSSTFCPFEKKGSGRKGIYPFRSSCNL